MGDSNTTVLTTISGAPGDADAGDLGAGDEGEGVGEGAGTEGGAPPEGTGATPPTPDAKQLELAKKWERVNQRETKTRRLETELTSRLSKAEERERAAEARAKQLEEDMAAFEADPVAFSLKKGKDPTDIVRRSAQPKSPMEIEIEKMKAERAAEKSEQEKRAAAEEQRQAEARKHHTMLSFVREITPAECPAIVAMHAAPEVPNLVTDLLNEKGDDGLTLLQAFKEEHGRNPSNKEIRQTLELRTMERAKTTYAALKKLFEPKDAQSQAAPKAPAANSDGPSLSNQHAGQTISKKPPGAKLSLEERRAQGLRGIRAELEAEPES